MAVGEQIYSLKPIIYQWLMGLEGNNFPETATVLHPML